MKREIKIGLLSIITIGIIIWGYNFIIGKNLFANEKTFYVKYSNVQDLAVSSAVMVSGMPVGSVISIELNPENVKEIMVTLTVASKIKIPKTTKAVLKSMSALGGKFIELDFNQLCEGSNCAENGDELQAVELGLIGSILNPAELNPYVEKIGPAMDTIFAKMGNADSDLAISQIIYNLNGTMANLNGITSEMNKVMARSGSDLSKIAKNLANVTASLTNSQDKINTILENFEVVSNDLKEVSISNTMAKTDATIDQANETLKGVESTMTEANNSMAELTSILKKIDDKEGTLGSLLNDEALYNNLETTTKQLSLLLQDFRLNPKRYVNVSVFGKKSKDYTYPDDDPAKGK